MGNVTLFAKLLPFPASTIITGRAAFSVLILAIFLFIRGKRFVFSSFSDFAKVFGIGILFGIHWVTYFHSIQVSTVAIGMLSLFTYPVFTSILEPLFFGHKIDKFSVFLTLFSFCGLAIIVPEFNWADNHFQGVVWGLVSAVLYSLRNILTKQMHSHYPSSQLLLVQLIATSLLLLPFASGFWEMVSEPKYLLYQVLLAGVFTALAHTLWIRSFASLPVTTAGIFSTMSPLYGSFAAWLVLGEVPPERIWLAGAVILFCAIMEMIRQSSSLREKPI
ncbi:DMT family transporter [Leptospira ilyithenensis]|uniref:DMT family transporter n=2 Tax=Leptospira ilyithenensis TaxID=2484901 RepID=A0A4R9LV77_9LEPT|nr:DMT family transporter [Leptospira ilyithenensis]